jgi:hypothetical protein
MMVMFPIYASVANYMSNLVSRRARGLAAICQSSNYKRCHHSHTCNCCTSCTAHLLDQLQTSALNYRSYLAWQPALVRCSLHTAGALLLQAT